jgi:hypothetical protein
LQLWRNGYEPIPTTGKEVYIKGWQTNRIDETRIDYEIREYPDHTSTGLRTGRLVGVDIDLSDPDEAALIQEVVEVVLGPTLLRRRGSKGAMLLYRNAEDPIGKIRLNHQGEVDPTIGKPKSKVLVELFGKGGQFVAYGRHPITGNDYEWLEPGMEPLKMPFQDLPVVRTDQLRELARHLREALAAMGYVVNTNERRAADHIELTGHDEAAIDITEKFLELLAPSRMSARGFRNFACPGCGRNDGRSGLRVLSNGGFEFHCFHSSCDYNRTTGWQPGSRIGERVLKLYELMGGDPEEIKPKRWLPQGLDWQEMLAELSGECAAQAGYAESNRAWDTYLNVCAGEK